jgi:DNA polymerase-3 subunit delta'
MSWYGLEGHDHLVDRFRCALQQKRLASTFLFVGPAGVGKRRFALRLAQSFLCQTVDPVELQPCGRCSACLQVEAGSHPDVEVIKRPEGKSVIPMDLLVGDREHRSQEGLCHWISLKPSSGRRRIAIIDDADFLNAEGANGMLKTLEEPPPGAVLILIGTSEQRQLPTIRSRCQTIRFRPLPDDVVARIAQEQHWAADKDAAERLALLAEGSLDRASVFSNPDLLEFALPFVERWRRCSETSTVLAKELQSFVNEGGKDASSRREYLRQVIELLIRELRGQLHQLAARRSSLENSTGAEGPSGADVEIQLEGCQERLDRCLEALREIDANANLATLVECFVDDLR